MDANNGEVWAKLDAGTEEYYRLVNRPNFPLAHVLENIRAAAVGRPIVIQSLWMRVHDEPPPDEEIRAFCSHLAESQSAGGEFKLVQVYTIARRPAEEYVTPLAPAEVDTIAQAVRAETGIPTEVFYGSSGV